MRVVKFASVGALNTVIDFVVFNLLVLVFGFGIVVANLVSYSAGIANSYLWNRNWTFADRRSSQWRPELFRFVIANLGGLAVNTGMVWLLVRALGLVALSSDAATSTWVPPVAKAGAIAGTMVFNYLVFRFWVFGSDATAE